MNHLNKGDCIMKKSNLINATLVVALAVLAFLGCSKNPSKHIQPPSRGLVAFWPMNEESGNTVADTSGNGLNGKANGATIVSGVVGNAREFDGEGDSIEVQDNDLLDINDSLTIMLWARLDPSDVEGILISKRLYSDVACQINYDIKYGFTPGHNYLSFQFGTGCTTGSNYALTDVPGFSDGNWHHLAISFVFGNPSSAKWVFDGTLMAGTWTHWDGSPSGGTEIPPTNSNNLEIGYQLSTSPGYMKGALDQIRIYNQALTISKIESIYLEEKLAPPPRGLIAFWSLNEASGNTVADSSGYGLNGTVSGATIVSGVVGNAREFDGVNDLIEVPDNDLLDINDSLTIMLWAKLDSSDLEGLLISKRLYNDVTCQINYDIKYGFTPGHNYLSFQFGTGCFTGSNYALTDIPGLSDGNWHHLAISFVFGNPSSAKWVYDGTLMAGTWTHWDGSIGGGTEIPPTNSNNLEIGQQLSTSHGYMKGAIDQIRIYNQALTESEVTGIYLDEKP
jgi:hypothetical protein